MIVTLTTISFLSAGLIQATLPTKPLPERVTTQTFLLPQNLLLHSQYLQKFCNLSLKLLRVAVKTLPAAWVFQAFNQGYRKAMSSVC